MKRQGLFAKVLFMDVILNMLVGVMAIVQLLKVETPPPEEKKKDSLETDGQYAVVMTWPDAANDDVDLHVRDPSGKTVNYNTPMAELMHLEYDDRGELGDRTMTSTGEVAVALNRERVILRGAIAGEYVANVHMFAKRAQGPTAVTVELYRLQGADTPVIRIERVLTRNGEEQTAFRFTLSPDGEMTGMSELPTSLLGSTSVPTGGMSFPTGGFP